MHQLKLESRWFKVPSIQHTNLFFNSIQSFSSTAFSTLFVSGSPTLLSLESRHLKLRHNFPSIRFEVPVLKNIFDKAFSPSFRYKFNLLYKSNALVKNSQKKHFSALVEKGGDLGDGMNFRDYLVRTDHVQKLWKMKRIELLIFVGIFFVLLGLVKPGKIIFHVMKLPKLTGFEKKSWKVTNPDSLTHNNSERWNWPYFWGIFLLLEEKNF